MSSECDGVLRVSGVWFLDVTLAPTVGVVLMFLLDSVLSVRGSRTVL